MDLDTAIRLFDLVETFDEYKEGLREVLNKSTKVSDPNEARERVMEVVNAKKADLMENNPEFKAIMDAKVRENKMRADESKALHKATMAEAEAKASMARSKAMSRVRGAIPDSDLDDFVATTKIKTRTFDEAKEQSEETLVCPICNSSNKGNIINDTPTCCHNTKEYGPWHRLVTPSELKNYNRAYRRRWKRK